jgi:hypothetical protein
MSDSPELLFASGLAERALTRTGEIVEKHGPRLSGSRACLDAAATIRRDFESFCDSVHTQDFTAHPSAFLGFIRILVVTYGLGVTFLWMNLPILGWLSVGFGVVNMLLEYIWYYHFIDRFYPATTGRNVWGVIEPSGPVERVVVLSGHHDSAQRFNFYEDGRPYQSREKRNMAIFFLLFAILTILAVLDLKKGNFFNPGKTEKTALVIAIVFSFGFLWVLEMWFFLNEEGTPGAGDNLISSMMFAEVAQHFKRSKLQRTRIVLVSFDAEECGLRGSHAFWQRYKSEFGGIPTIHLNADCPYYHDELRFLIRDVNWTVKLDQGLAEECVKISNSLGFKAITCPIAFFAGGTDSGEAARAGIRTTCLLSLPFTNVDRATVYHTINDTVDTIEPRAIAQAIAVAIQLATLVDDGRFVV